MTRILPYKGRIWPCTGKYGPVKTRILASFNAVLEKTSDSENLTEVHLH